MRCHFAQNHQTILSALWKVSNSSWACLFNKQRFEQFYVYELADFMCVSLHQMCFFSLALTRINRMLCYCMR